LLVLQAYLDDSGKEEPVFMLAGYLATAERWAEFSDSWDAALRADPPISYLKMRDAWGRRGEFAGWTEDLRDAKIRLLLETVARYGLVTLAVVIDHEAYKHVEAHKIAAKLKSPYFVCAYKIMTMTLTHLAAVGSAEPVEFIFDEQGKQAEQVLAAWRFLKSAAPASVRPSIGSRPSYFSEQERMPLQAADMFAWMLRRCYADQADGKPSTILRWDDYEGTRLPCVLTECGETELLDFFGQVQKTMKENGWEHTMPPIRAR
jgi:hypothetical protein